jgi:O-antigen/teichoic acid export membrane protein
LYSDIIKKLNPKSIPTVRINIVANFFGRFWAGFLNIILMPIYIHLLGIESYSLVGFYATLQAVLAIMDIGLSTVMNREMARLSAGDGTTWEQRDLVRTLEIIYWGTGILLGAMVAVTAPWIATKWIGPGSITSMTITRAVILMGVVFACQWPSSLYAGGLAGRQNQLALNTIKALMGTLQGGGAILVLWLISPSISMFFFWQALTSLGTTFLMAAFLWKMIPSQGHRAKFQSRLFATFWRFAAGVTGISITVTIFGQLDKVLLAHLLPLADFGYYTVASNVGTVFVLGLIAPISAAVFPRLTQLVAAGKENEIIAFYHKACQLVVVAFLPFSLLLVFFSQEILALWFRDPILVKNTYLLLCLVAIGTTINGILTVPYLLQISYGWTSLTLYSNILGTVFLGATIWFAVNAYGAVAAPIIRIIVNAAFLVLYIPIMHGRLLRTEMKRWYKLNVFVPIVILLLSMSLGRLLYSQDWSNWISIIYLVVLWSISTTIVAVAVVEPQTRKNAMACIQSYVGRYVQS